MLLEVCANSLESAIAAQKGGAHRIELCQNLEVGGLTPSLELLEQVKAQIDIPVYVLIRSRAGDFCYSEQELTTMETQIKQVTALHFPGVVIGCLDENQQINHEATTRLMEAAGYIDVTFHKAFDEVPDAFEALDTLREMGIQRILTSGCAKTALEGLDTLAELVDEAEDELIIMPGGSIRPENLDTIMESGASEYHSSGIISGQSVTNQQAVAQMITLLKGA